MSVVIGGTSGPSLAGSLEPVAFTGWLSATRPYRNSAGDQLSQNLHHAQEKHHAATFIPKIKPVTVAR